MGSLANKAADKFIPKELAPFLPMLAPIFMGGPLSGPILRYLGPQILTALASGKQTGDIDLTSQAGLQRYQGMLCGYLLKCAQSSKTQTEPDPAIKALLKSPAQPTLIDTTLDEIRGQDKKTRKIFVADKIRAYIKGLSTEQKQNLP